VEAARALAERLEECALARPPRAFAPSRERLADRAGERILGRARREREEEVARRERVPLPLAGARDVARGARGGDGRIEPRDGLGGLEARARAVAARCDELRLDEHRLAGELI